jgi:hypothetical protein
MKSHLWLFPYWLFPYVLFLLAHERIEESDHA